MITYVCNGSAATTIKYNCTSLRNISIGVAQGSEMGPLLLIIYIAILLTLGLLGRMILYADDTAFDTPGELQNCKGMLLSCITTF